MGDQTKEPKSSGSHNSHANAELSQGTSPEERIPLAPYQGRGRYPAHEKDRVCLPLKDIGAGTASPPNQ